MQVLGCPPCKLQAARDKHDHIQCMMKLKKLLNLKLFPLVAISLAAFLE